MQMRILKNEKIRIIMLKKKNCQVKKIFVEEYQNCKYELKVNRRNDRTSCEYEEKHMKQLKRNGKTIHEKC